MLFRSTCACNEISDVPHLSPVKRGADQRGSQDDAEKPVAPGSAQVMTVSARRHIGIRPEVISNAPEQRYPGSKRPHGPSLPKTVQ